MAWRDHVLIGKERTDIGRPHDWGYPIRGILTIGHLYLQNFSRLAGPAAIPRPVTWTATPGPQKPG